jgi:CBS domain-containing protein
MGDNPKLVRDLMTVGVSTCPPDTPVVDIARLLLEKDLEGMVVLDQDGQAVGVVTQDELVKAYTHDNVRDLVAEDVMTEGMHEVPPDIPLTAAAQLMQDMGTRIVFLTHNANGIIYPAAMLSYRHLLRHLTADNDTELRDLGIEAERRSPIEIFIEKRDAARRQAELHKRNQE